MTNVERIEAIKALLEIIKLNEESTFLDEKEEKTIVNKLLSNVTML